MGNYFSWSWWRGYNVDEPTTPPTANIRPPTANIRPPTADIRPPTENIRPPTANTGPPEQDVQAPQAQWVEIHSIGRLTEIRGASAHGNLVWVTARGRDLGNMSFARVAVFWRTTDADGRHPCVATRHIDSPLRIAANDNVAWLSLERTGQIQELRLNGEDMDLTRTFPDVGELTAPEGLAYKESTGTLYVCCNDSVKLVNVAGGYVVGTLRRLRRPDLPRPRSVSVLNNKILVAYDQRHLVLYANDAEEGTLLRFQTPLGTEDITHNGVSFLVCDTLRQSLWMANGDERDDAWVELTLPVKDVKPVHVSCGRAPDNQYFLYFVGVNKRLGFDKRKEFCCYMLRREGQK